MFEVTGSEANAIKAQRNHPSWRKTTDGFKQNTREYEKKCNKMKRTIITLILILFSSTNSFGQLSFVIDSLFLYTIEDIPQNSLNGGLDKYDNIQKYGPYIEVYGRVINLAQKDTTTHYYRKIEGESVNRILQTTEYYISFKIGSRHYKTRYYYVLMDDVPYFWSRRIKQGDVIYDTISPRESVPCYFCSHFLYKTNLFPKKNSD